MPYKFESEKKLIPKKYDKRIKLTKENKEEIRRLYASGNYSQRNLAAMYKVSRRLIQFVLDPEKAKRNKELYNQRGGSMYYYDKDKNKDYMKTHRRYKQKLNKNNLLEESK